MNKKLTFSLIIATVVLLAAGGVAWLALQKSTTNPLQTFAPETINPVTGTLRKVGDKEFNFLIQKITSNSVDGLSYILYPVAMMQGQPKTLHVGDMVGYACEGKTATLASINAANQTATFNEIITNPPPGGCPI